MSPWEIAGVILGLATAATVIATAIARGLRRHGVLLDEDGDD